MRYSEDNTGALNSILPLCLQQVIKMPITKAFIFILEFIFCVLLLIGSISNSDLIANLFLVSLVTLRQKVAVRAGDHNDSNSRERRLFVSSTSPDAVGVKADGRDHYTDHSPPIRAVVHMDVGKTCTTSIQSQSDTHGNLFILGGYEMPWKAKERNF